MILSQPSNGVKSIYLKEIISKTGMNFSIHNWDVLKLGGSNSKNAFRIPPGRAPSIPKVDTNTSPSTLNQTKNTYGGTQFAKKSTNVGQKSPQRAHSGTQVGPQNRPKSCSERQKHSPRWRPIPFSSISRAISVRIHIPGRFSESLNLENCAPITAGA